MTLNRCSGFTLRWTDVAAALRPTLDLVGATRRDRGAAAGHRPRLPVQDLQRRVDCGDLLDDLRQALRS
jgi:hypothetical protein